MPASQVTYITGRSFFPHLIEEPFAGGLHLAFTFAAGATVIAIIASAARGRRYVHGAVEAEAPADAVTGEMVSLPVDAELADERADGLADESPRVGQGGVLDESG
jgi:hypothetical protein